MSDDNNLNPQEPVKQKESAAQKTQKAVQNAKKTVDTIKKMAQAAKSASLAGSIMTALIWVIVAIVIIILVVGIIMFLVTMPGMVMEKLKAIVKEIGNYVAAFFGADTTQQIEDTEIYDTLTYLEQMGWDIKGEGFLNDFYDENSSKGDIEKAIGDDKTNEGYEIDEQSGVVRDSNGNIILAKSDFITTYIMSDNYVYTIKNDNLATQDKDAEGFFGKVKNLVAGIKTAWYKIKNFTLGPVFDALGITDAMVDGWGKRNVGILL